MFGTLLTRPPSQKLVVLFDSVLISLLKVFLLQQLSCTPFTLASFLSFVLCNAVNDNFYNAKLAAAPFFLTSTIQLLFITSKMNPKLLGTVIPLCAACQSSIPLSSSRHWSYWPVVGSRNITYSFTQETGTGQSFIFSPLTSPHSEFLQILKLNLHFLNKVWSLLSWASMLYLPSSIQVSLLPGCFPTKADIHSLCYS